MRVMEGYMDIKCVVVLDFFNISLLLLEVFMSLSIYVIGDSNFFK